MKISPQVWWIYVGPEVREKSTVFGTSFHFKASSIKIYRHFAILEYNLVDWIEWLSRCLDEIIICEGRTLLWMWKNYRPSIQLLFHLFVGESPLMEAVEWNSFYAVCLMIWQTISDKRFPFCKKIYSTKGLSFPQLRRKCRNRRENAGEENVIELLFDLILHCWFNSFGILVFREFRSGLVPFRIRIRSDKWLAVRIVPEVCYNKKPNCKWRFSNLNWYLFKL